MGWNQPHPRPQARWFNPTLGHSPSTSLHVHLTFARVALPRRHDGGRLYRRVVEEIPASQKDTPQ